MRVQNCFHPNTFINPYTGEKVTSRCGKCDACRNTRASNWVMRLDLEAQCHKYVYFATLTYDDYNVPQIIRLRYEDYTEKGFAYLDSETGQIIETKDIKATFEEKDWQFCRESKVVNILSVRDFQLFFKRLRYYFKEVDKSATLRYFICGELGPRTYRPHGHLLLFFDSDSVRDSIELLLRKSWPYGNIYDPHRVIGSAAEYCASYINSTSKLPKLYLHPQIRPFSLFSKSPAIGTLYPAFGKVREVFDSGTCKFRRFDKASHSFKDEYLFRAIESRLYPRLPRFGSLFHDDRVTLYRLFEQFAGYDLSAREIAQRLKVEYIDNKNVINPFLRRYFKEIAFKSIPAVTFQKIVTGAWKFKDYPFRPNFASFIEQPFIVHRTKTRIYNEDSLIRFVRSISRLYHQSKVFGISIEDYVTKIENYVENKKMLKWREDYEFQNKYFARNPKWHWIYFDYDFYSKCLNSSLFSLSRESFTTLDYLFDGDIPKKSVDGIFYLDILDINTLEDFQNFKLLHRKIAHDLVKQKENNDYALAKKDKFGAIINYQNL